MKEFPHFLFLLSLFYLSTSQYFPTSLTINYNQTSSPYADLKYSSQKVFYAAGSSIHLYSISSQIYTHLISPASSVYKIAVSTDATLIAAAISSSNKLVIYNLVNDLYESQGDIALTNTADVQTVTISSDKSLIFVSEAMNLKVIRKNVAGTYYLDQTLSLSQNVYDIGVSSDNSILLAASPRTIKHYSTSSSYAVFQTYTIQPTPTYANTKGIMDLSNDGTIMAFVSYQQDLEIALKNSTNAFVTAQKIQMNQDINDIQISDGNWMMAVLTGDYTVKIYVNNTGQFEFITKYSSDSKINNIELSSDDNYLTLGLDTTKFSIRINKVLYQKKMIDNAEAIFFSCTFGGLVVIIILYCLSTMKKETSKVQDMGSNRQTNPNNNQVHPAESEDTQLQFVNKN